MRKTIGVLTYHMGGTNLSYVRRFTQSIVATAKKFNTRVIFYTGGFYNTPTHIEGLYNYIYEFANADKLDGIISISSLIGEFCSKEDINSFHKNFTSIPIVSAGVGIPGIPSVLIDNYVAMRSVVEHLLSDHNPQKIVYLGGPLISYEGTERYRAFCDVLMENGREPNKDLFFEGKFISELGYDIALHLLKNGIAFDAVVSANDTMAIGFLEAMSEHGKVCPRDYLITGFDDMEISSLLDPPLTTVFQDSFIIGEAACVLLHEILMGKAVPQITLLPTKLRIRESCGCSSIGLQDMNDVETLLTFKRDFFKREQDDYTLGNISSGLINTNTETELCLFLDRELPKIRELVNCHLCDFEKIEGVNYLRPFISYSRSQGAHLTDKDKKYNTTAIHSEMNTDLRIIESLNFGEKILGVVIFESNKLPYSAFGTLRKQLSQTLQHIKTFSRIAELNSNLSIEVAHLSSLRTIDQAISATYSRDALLNVLMSEILSQQKVDAVIFSLIDPSGTTPIVAGSRGFLGKAPEGERHITPSTVYIQNILVDTLPKILENKNILFAHEGFIGYCRIPLSSQGETNGILEIFARTQLPSDPEWHLFLQTLAGQAAIAIENTRLVEGLKRANSNLREAYNTTIEGWSRALDLRDHETEGHCSRVAQLCVQLGTRIGLLDHDIENLYRGALLHDIGKVGIPDSILLKPGPLTVEERGIMNLHPQYSYDLLSPIEFLLPALSIPWCHHEKWDGSGYPQGLKGTDIPLFARIFAVIDVWDALSSERPYRGAWEKERTIEYIKSEAGKHFDPDIVKIFFEMISE
ncbi:MAG TPA: HD domain-containing phosphohydrolase [Treponemataceae bacterium]|nr:HD domain-containing phosphohydrolase [Treponemataceae bacterium]